ALYPYAHQAYPLGNQAVTDPDGVRLEKGTWQVEERIVFSSPTPNGHQLFLLDPGTTDRSQPNFPKSEKASVQGVRQLGRLPGDNRYPAVSPDGDTVAFTSGGAIHVMDLLKPLPRRLVEGSEPTWSPDASMLAYVHKGNLWVVNADGSQPTQLTTRGGVRSPSWSRQPYRLVFASLEGGVSHLVVLTLAVQP
ncbi:MAG: DPP IV N-terminal domain-containing protein, partial [Candidatus Eremiobacterota bacterium]